MDGDPTAATEQARAGDTTVAPLHLADLGTDTMQAELDIFQTRGCQVRSASS
jgi:hypothetical protein